ncbi:hypothetical protein [Deinococcus hopiensis]|uniref:Uncharacterized protein n=1 Tax=Deinococcus hopiensis KR-140 TaxID=695939 RepID=A0A1W1UP34_9DEIO|nr:hypothetical protein [Deinococcus hopiensis]SMB82852.1 hypothetical protein SAMN00790413_04167 [Deinococcus hopiensis KR-140]
MKRNTVPYIIALSSLLTLTPALARETGPGHHGGHAQHAAHDPSSSAPREAEPRDDRGTHGEAGDDRGRGGQQEPGDDHGHHVAGHR